MPADNTRRTALDAVVVKGAHEHNLKWVDVRIPHGVLAVVTGVSGSGKSSLAFDTIAQEGRRRYLETFSSYARQFFGAFSRPAAREIAGLSPTVAVEQATGAGNPRSTVGTMTELYDLLRLCWARLGSAPAGAGGPRLERRLFSFNSPHGACPACKGIGVEDRLDPDLLVSDPSKTVRGGALRITTPTGYLIYSQVTIDVLDQVCRAHGFSVDLAWNALTPEQRHVILNGSDRIRIPFGKHPLESRMRWTGITAKPREEGVYKGILPVMEQILRQKRNANILRFVRSMPCRACHGTRLRPEALAVTFHGASIAEAAALSVDDLRRFFERVSADRRGAWSPFTDIRTQVDQRCDTLQRLGLGYLALDRESTTLSAGEAQRVRLAALAGIGLQGVLFVLDEPSIGLHHHDTRLLLDVLRAIRDRGNTVLVVEHDDQTILQADWILDVGPGAGDAGGEVLFSGPARAFTQTPPSGDAHRLAESRTRAFLTGEERIALPSRRRAGSGALVVEGVTRHNLHGVGAEFRLGALNVVTGVSGAGKSTLVEETRRLLGGGGPGGPASVRTSARIDKVIEIDQSPIGRTPRSNPATYTGLFDHVRALFAAEPDARSRSFGKGRFSFNVHGGRCSACEGAGVRQIGMQFLGTLAVTCGACGGRRFNGETLQVRYRGANIHDVLEMSIADALVFFGDQPAIARPLGTLDALGLGYLRVGHPATMLSGGEAQRVKLAAELARPGTGRTLYLLDEPTTGLHPADIVRLLAAIDGLIERGNTAIVIEHHLDVIKVADRVIDLGPGSGARGGRVIAAGTPEEVAATPGSLTGAALGDALAAATGPWSPVALAAQDAEAAAVRATRAAAPIRLTGVSTHNLQHIDVEIPRHCLTVITGVSGSGKSSLAFDTIFAEGQRRFADSFSTYARRFVQQDGDARFDAVSGLTPTVAIRQQAPSRNPRSTVATLTEVHDAYRLLYSRMGTRACPDCSTGLDDGRCPSCGFEGARPLTASMFSPNSEVGACPQCRGLGYALECDPATLVSDPSKPLSGGAMDGHKAGRFYGDPHGQHMAALTAAGAALGLDFSVPWEALDDRARDVALRGTGGRMFDVEWQYRRGARAGAHRFTSAWPGLLELVRLEYERKHADRRGEALAPLMAPMPCRACGGGRLKPEALAVRVGGVNIHELLARTVDESLAFFAGVDDGRAAVDDRDRFLSADLGLDIISRLSSLRDAGLGYLALGRSASTLSGGEAQRVRLAAELRSGLTGITYVLDEPTAGLHVRDTSRLLGLLCGLRDAGNTVVVVEHDLDVIAAADHVIEIGPGAGPHGGRVIVSGAPADVASCAASRTGPHLQARLAPHAHAPRRALSPGITVCGAAVHNLSGLDVEVPAGGLVVVTGVSGSGKSSLVFDVIAPSLERALSAGAAPASAAVNCGALVLRDAFQSIAAVGSAPLSSSPWSNAATLVGCFDAIRAVFAASPQATSLGLRKQDFSTSGPGGRCDACEGRGQTRVGMDFLPDVWVRCEDCGGARYGPAALTSVAGGRSIADVLAMSVDEAQSWAEGLASNHAASMRKAFAALRDVGLGYLALGQPARTLSGGERQRLALATALLARGAGRTLYVCDEPTTGLHPDDVERLLGVFDRLIDGGHTVLAVEHNLEVIARADWVIDLGPEGGTGGGQLVAAGTPEMVASCDASHTGRALRNLRSGSVT
ncbi:MAG: excinuclease ABC subunit UvrA [Vicinamibacterales bacterium]|nr:excinuclease ABC subunit UvrA [Vicinamibacterales bacterium]